MRALIQWARRQRSGRLTLFFRLYDAVRLTMSRWRQSETALRVYGWRAGGGSAAAYARHARALMAKHARLTAAPGCDAAEAIDVGKQAAACLDKALALRPDWLELYEPLASMLTVSGRMEEAAAIFGRRFQMQTELAEARQLEKLGIRFVSASGATGNIGGLGGLEGYVKVGLLGWRPPHHGLLLLPPGARVPNRCFLDYWRRYITFITNADTIERLTPVARLLEDPFHVVVTCNGNMLFAPSAAALIRRQWHAESRPPVLTLSDADHERGWRCLEKLGVPRGAWFVCLHVREAGFRRHKATYDVYRNADVDSYVPAIKSIVARGGWVIRMGDPTMKPLPPMPGVIDYVYTDARSDWMDVFCGAECRFFVGTASGLAAVPLAFGVPCVLTNYLPTLAVGFSDQDLFIPKLCWSVKDERLLTFAELMSAPASTSVVQLLYDWWGLRPVDNTPDEINDLTLEMLARLEGSQQYSEEDKRLQDRFNALTAAGGTLIGLDKFGINCRIGSDFLRKYASLLPAIEEMPVEGHRPAWGKR